MTEDNHLTDEEKNELKNSEVSEQTTGAEELESEMTSPKSKESDLEAAAVEVVKVAKPSDPKEKAEDYDPFRWFSLRVISGKERKIKERIEFEVDRSNWKSFVTQVLVPSEKVYKIRNGKKVILERNILPGYILIQAIPDKLTGEVAMAIANLPNVIHFLGRENPIPMQQSEANRLLGIVDDSLEIGEAMIEPYIVGETVKIVDGPFNEFIGDIQEVNEEKKKLKVIVKIFGRGTEVELNFMQVEKQA
jgi:transcription termination/antitermination protein NusG